MYDKYVGFEISAHESFLNNHPHVRSNKILKLINIIVSGSKLTEDPKQDSNKKKFNRQLSSTWVLCGVRVARSLVSCVLFCRSLFVLVIIVLSVLRFTDSNYPFVIFKLFLAMVTKF